MRLPFLNHKSKKGRIKNMKIQRDGKEYTLTAEEVMEAHEEFVTSFIPNMIASNVLQRTSRIAVKNLLLQ